LVALSLPAAEPPLPPAHKVTLQGDQLTPAMAAKAFRESASIDVDVAALDPLKTFAINVQNADFWTVIGHIADKTDGKVVTTGGRVALKPGRSLAPVGVSGPFRFTVREVNAKNDPETGKSGYEITLEACWEPWLLAYRIDSTPSVVTAQNDQGKAISIGQGGARSLTSGNLATLSVRPAAVRADKTVTLHGSIKVTIADKMLTFTFDGGKPAAVPAQEGVKANVKKSGVDGVNWFADVELRPAAGGVPIESHEYAVFRNNTLELVSPTGERFKADATEFDDPSTRYVFKNRGKQVGAGWKLEYRTPGPMREIVVPFELKDIRLP
jgi:hypothetical protein